MNEAKVIFAILIIAVVFGPIIYKLILKLCQDIDYKRQLDMKIPERKYEGNNPDAYVSLRMRGMQNIISPK